MAHTFGRTIVAHASSAGNPITVASITILPGETILWLSLKVVGSTNRAGTAPTLGPYTFVQRNSVQKAVTTPECSAEAWDVLNAQPGTYTLTIPNTGALTVFYALVSGMAAPGGHSEFDVAVGTNNTSTNPSPGAMTLTEAGGISFAIVATGANAWSPSAQAGTVINNTSDAATTGTGRQYLLSAARGSVTLSWTFATSEDWGAIACGYKEVPPHAFPAYMRPSGTGMMPGDG